MTTRASAPLRVDPQGATIVVSITFDPSGTASPVTAKNGSSSISLPDTISTTKTYWLPPARYIVSATLNGVTIHDQPYDVDGSQLTTVTPVLDFAETTALIGAGSGGGTVASVVAGTNVTVDSTDPANPIVSASSGASVLYQVRTALPSAQIKTLGSVPVQVAPAPGAGLAIVLVFVAGSYIPGDTPFDFAGGSYYIDWQGGSLGQAGLSLALDGTDPKFSFAQTSSESAQPTADAANKALVLSNSGPFDATTGNGSIVVTVSYAIVPLA